MIHLYIIAAVMLYVHLETEYDIKNWGNVDHVAGFLRRAVLLTVICAIVLNPYPFVLFYMGFDPLMNHKAGLPLDYIGKTSKIDILRRKWWGEDAGAISMGIEFTVLLLCIGYEIYFLIN